MNCHKFQVHVYLSLETNNLQEEKIQFFLQTIESRLDESDLDFEHLISRGEEEIYLTIDFPEKPVAQGYNMNLIDDFFLKLSINMFRIQQAETSIYGDDEDQFLNHHEIMSPIVVI